MSLPIVGFGTKNLLPNPGFQVATTGWTATGGTIARATDTESSSGSRMRLTTTTASGTRRVASALLTEDVAPGGWFTLAGRLRGTSGSVYRLTLIFTDSSNNVLQTVTGASQFGTGTGTGKYLKTRVKAIAPTSTAKVQAIAEVITNSSGDVLDIGGLTLTPTSGAPNYFDGDSALATWAGSSYNSTTTQQFTSSPTPVLVDGFCLTTEGWAITNPSGRWSLAEARGDDLTVSGRSGYIFEANKPTGPGLFAWEIYVVGATEQGIIPASQIARRQLFNANMETLLTLFNNKSTLSTVECWQPDGTMRQASVQFVEVTDPEVVAGGTRGVFGVAGTLPDVFWEDSDTTVQEFTINANPFQADLTSFAGMSGWLEDAIVEIVGPLTDPSITDVKSGNRVQRTGTVSSATTWTIDVGESTTKVGATDLSNVTTHYGSSRLLPISNHYISLGTVLDYPRLTVTGTGFTGATKLRVTGRRKWTSA